MPDLPCLYGPSGNVGPTSDYFQRGVSLLPGLDLRNAWFDVSDNFASNEGAWLRSAVGTGTRTFVPGTVGGVLRHSSGATANSIEDHFAGAGVSNSKTKLFYIAAQFKIATAIDAQASGGMGWQDNAATASAFVGVCGPVDSANFVLQYGGFFATSKQVLASVDTNNHIFEFWNGDRNSYNVRFDGGTIFNVVPGAGVSSGGCLLFRGVRNGTTAADRRLEIDWHVAVGERA